MNENEKSLFDPIEQGNLTNNHFWRDYVTNNHVVLQRLVPELLGEFDNATEMQAQMAYVLACLRRLARDQSILKYEFDSVVDGLLATINKILNEFSKEITEEINKIWEQLNRLYNTDVIAGQDIAVSLETVSGDVTTKKYTVASKVDVKPLAGNTGISVTKKDSTFYVENIQTVSQDSGISVTKTGNDYKVKNLQTVSGGTGISVEKTGNDFKVSNTLTFKSGDGVVLTQDGNTITASAPFLIQLYNELIASGAYSGTMGTGTFNGHLAYGNISVFGGTQDGTSYIRTSKNAQENDLAGGIA